MSAESLFLKFLCPKIGISKNVFASARSRCGNTDCSVGGLDIESHSGQLCANRKSQGDIKPWARPARPYGTAAAYNATQSSTLRGTVNEY